MTTHNSYDRITFSLPHSMNISLDALKVELQRSKSEIIKQAIEDFLKRQEEKRLEEAVATMAAEYENNKELIDLTDLDSEDFQ